jgi:Flp pilus assembly protein TadG
LNRFISLRFLKNRRGATAVEFALILPFFLSMIFGLIEFGRAMWIRNTMQYAVEEAARYGSISGASSADISTYAQGKVLVIDPSTITFDVTVGASDISVTATHDFEFLAAGLLPYGPITLQASAQYPL